MLSLYGEIMSSERATVTSSADNAIHKTNERPTNTLKKH